MTSFVSIVPAEKKTDEHSVPLSPTGAAPATHYGLHGWQTKDVEPELGEAKSFRSPDDGPQYVEAQDHFLGACQKLGLQRIFTAEAGGEKPRDPVFSKEGVTFDDVKFSLTEKLDEPIDPKAEAEIKTGK